ncbi:MAG: hypothetical protein F4X65_12900 [Chloroflexi bacterium]|nr:hypothetical protein [Chloroflexota bacterium]
MTKLELWASPVIGIIGCLVVTAMVIVGLVLIVSQPSENFPSEGYLNGGYPTWFECGQDEYMYYVAQEWPPSLEDMEAACDPTVPRPEPPDGEWIEGRAIWEKRSQYP